MSVIKKEQNIKQTLDMLYQKAQINEALFYKFQRLELHLLSARTLRGLFHILFSELKESLMLSYISILLYDPEEVIHDLLQDEKTTKNETRNLTLVKEHNQLTKKFDNALTPQFFSKKQNKTASSNAPCHFGSSLRLPLLRHDCLIGYLELSSHSPERFVESQGTLFLERLAQIIAVCIENSVNMSQTKLLSLRDGLTGIYNRRYFEERIKEEILISQQQKHTMSCIFLDVDYFKHINDQYGHSLGDQVLKQTAEIIKTSLRKTDILARYGGEEFIVLLPNTEQHQAINITERIRTNVNLKNYEHEGYSFNVTLSAGLSAFCPKNETTLPAEDIAHRIINKADQALYKAKENGRNQVVYCCE